MNISKTNRVVHRDFGYFFVFITLVYAISGIALNHFNDWNSDYYVAKKKVNLNLPTDQKLINNKLVLSELKKIEEDRDFLMADFPSKTKVKIYFKSGELIYDLEKQEGELERVQKRYVFFIMNYMHRNPGGFWVWFSDIFAAALIIISISGLFILRGKKGFLGRGKWIVSAGIIITIAFIMFYTM